MARRTLLLLVISGCLVGVALFLAAFVFGGGGGSRSRPLAEDLPQQAEDLLDSINEYRSSVKGYSIRFPGDWTENPSKIDLGDASTDVFFALKASGKAGVAPTLSITSESVPPGTTAQDYLRYRLSFLDSVQAEVSEPRPVEVDGARAYLIDYKGYSQKYPLEATSVVLVKDGQGWEFTFAVPAGQRTEYRPLLAFVLRSVTIP
jgi:hypothetical protein